MLDKKNISVLFAGIASLSLTAQDKRPNFVWFMTEDVSDCYLSIYNDGRFGARTPNVERLARGGVVFRNAYSNAPVSSAARSTLITGCYAPAYGLSFHRAFSLLGLPEGQHFFPAYLRQAGYHTSNADKRDYNCIEDKDAWDISHGKMGDWRKRKDKSVPFFHVRTQGISHEGQLQFKEETYRTRKTRTDPADVFVHPNHPNTDLFRYTYATFYDRINQSDAELGQLIDMLKEDGELDNTFIFYMGDNGGALPYTKGYTSEVGLTVPLVVYVPEKWRERLHLKAGTFREGLVNFMDLGPTLLHLAGLEIPEFMDGRPVLGEDVTEKDLQKRAAWGYGDRFDECYAFNRTLTRGKFLYSRNFLPYHPKSLYADYRFRELAARQWRRMFEEGRLNEVQSVFFLPQGPEELYDLETDPYQQRNLVSNPRYRKVLKSMRKELKAHIVKTGDLGLYPECVWFAHKGNPKAFGDGHAEDIARYSDIADLQLLPFDKARKSIMKALVSEDPVDRYWGATVCASFGDISKLFDEQLRTLLHDAEPYVRSKAIVALSRYDGINPVEPMKTALMDARSESESFIILNDITYIRDHVHPYDFGLEMKDVPKKHRLIEWRIKHLQDKNY